MSMLGTKNPIYNDGRTKQSFKDETDINKILKRAQKTGTISHLNKHEKRYGDFANFDFFDAQLQLAAGRTIFDELPSELRAEFNQNPADFFEYVNDPANVDRLGELLPALAAPGRQQLEIKPIVADTPAEPEIPPEAPEAPPEAPTEPPVPPT